MNNDMERRGSSVPMGRPTGADPPVRRRRIDRRGGRHGPLHRPPPGTGGEGEGSGPGDGPPRTGAMIVRFIVKLAVIAGILAAVYIWVMGIHIQHGNRMYPFIMDGDLLITYKLDTYRAGDVVVYRSPTDGTPQVSRIATIGAYTLDFTAQGELLINGSIPNDKVFYPTELPETSGVTFPYQTTPDGYFLLDDFRTQGADSRVFGQIKREDLLGKVVYVFRRRGI